MLNPDVREIIDDPDVGGGVDFTVYRTKIVRVKGSVEKTTENIIATGNIQPETKTNTLSTNEDLMDEKIVIYTTFIFQNGGKIDGDTYLADELVYDGIRYRITSVNNYYQWGFTIGHATRMRE